ncbi:hypothetical protein GE21DRAFT_1223528, partial [Neurospora crassa]
IPHKKLSNVIKKTPTSKALEVTTSFNKLEGKIIAEVIVISTGPANSLYNNIPIKFITFKKIRKYLSKEI